MLAHLRCKIVVHDIFEIDLVKIVGPWMEDREAFVLDSLAAVLGDVVLDEGEVSLVG